MSLTRVDRDELLTALYTTGEDPPFQTFLRSFRRRVDARLTVLVGRSQYEVWTVLFSPINRSLAELDLPKLLQMRPDRVYAFADIAPNSTLEGRLVRSTHELGDQWLIAVDSKRGFAAVDSALMSELSPHLGIAGNNVARLQLGHMREAACAATLARCGVGWSLLDAGGGLIAGVAPPTSPRRRAALAEAASGGAEIVPFGEVIAFPFANASPVDDAALALFRIPPRPIGRAAAFARIYGVPLSEARLAIAMAEGASIKEAATALGITQKTARYYTKRLYAATSARGQADLIRLIWSGIIALA